MADVTIFCPSCNRKLRMPDDQMGQVVQCPLCAVVFVAPQRSRAEAVGPTAAPTPGKVVPVPSTVPQPLDTGGREDGPVEEPPARSQAPAGMAEPQPVSDVHRLLLMPGTLLLVCGVLNTLHAAWTLSNLREQGVGQMIRTAQEQFPGWMSPQIPPGQEEFAQGLVVFFAMVTLAMSVGTVFGAVQMLRLGRYWLALAGSILACVNILAGCCLINIPIGIWSVVVLCMPEVRNAFGAPDEAPKEDS